MNEQITPDLITADPVTPVETVETVTETPAAPAVEPTEDEAMLAAYARAMGTEEDAPEAVAPVEVELPPGLPVGLKTVWGKLDDEARSIIQKSQNELSGKLANQGRLVQQITPIRDVLVEAARDIPELQGMSPQQVASEVMHLARVNAEFKKDPVTALLKFADQAGMREQLAQALGVTPGQAPQQFNTIPSKIAELEQKLAQALDPEYIASQVSEVTARARTSEEVMAFAATAEHWAEIEADLPAIIPGVQAILGEQASAKDVLAKAHEIAVSLRFPQPPASPVAQPDRVQAAQKAKAVNLPGRQPAGDVVLNENDAMLAAYHRAMKK